MSEEHGQALWYRDSHQIAQVVKQKSGEPGRADPLFNKQGQGEHRCACITNDMPMLVTTPMFVHTGVGTNQGFGTNDNYKNLDGTRFMVQYMGPNRDCRMMWTLPSHDGPDMPGATGQPTLLPTVSPKGK